MNFSKLLAFYTQRTPRERKLIVVISAVFLVLGCWWSVQYLNASLVSEERLVKERLTTLEALSRSLAVYTRLDTRLKHLQQTYSQSEMTLEQVTSAVDETVKEAVGSGNYELDKARSTTSLDVGYDKQEFTLKLRSITLDQLVKLLHSLETGKAPLFLGKVNLEKSDAKSFSSAIEVFTLRKTAENS